jgi:pyruvate/2-oxoglutarate dehydrogenase complex dihydrolipoamide acyltransferase (E2) component
MKMEHAVPAPCAGRVKDVLVRPGDQVRLDAILAVVDPADPADPPPPAGAAGGTCRCSS